MSPRFERRVALPVSAAAAFDWHARPGAFERLEPPWDPVRVLQRSGGIEPGARVTLAVGPLRQRWTLEHRDTERGVRFRDVQVAGPFARWSHEHAFAPAGAHACTLTDAIDFALPAALAPATPWVRGQLARLFAYRQRVTADDLAMHDAAAAAPMTVLVSGASGLLGAALVPLLTTGGHAVRRLGRGSAAAGDARWDPDAGTLDPAALAGVDAVVHLAGASVAQRWTPAARERILASRVRGTRLLAETLARLPHPPRVLVAASAIGFYGDRGDAPVEESSGPGRGFLADVARAWEEATAPATAAGIRVVRVRIGLVLTPRGGVLQQLRLPFAFGAGGPLGSGRQWMSWIALDDLLAVLHAALVRDDLAGPVNAVAPGAVTNREFARVLGGVMGRPALVPAPAFALRALLGRAFADDMVLGGARVRPAALERAGHRFRFPALAEALRHVLGRAAGDA